ncbi:MAG: type III pantothenate kinase [Clostridia bacterium]|nr:type III pantothenate kinase [Clostridia bacterium]MDE6758646.1 type III pantothenate kinase [Clostridia bacterium]
MILVIDVGNTNIKIGVFENDSLIYSWRLSVKVVRTADEIGIVLAGLFGSANIDMKSFDGIIMSSVQPSLNYTMEHACEYYLGKKPMMVGVGIKTGLNIKYSNPQEVGADRIVNSVAAYRLYGGPCIVVDFGTATTFNVVSEKGAFMGGCIAPGIITALEGLVNNTAKLPRVEIVKPDSIIAKNTVAGLQAGMTYGYTGLVKYIIQKLKEESGCENMKVIATGGLSEIVLNVDNDKIIDIVDRSLTLKGLKLIYDLNA